MAVLVTALTLVMGWRLQRVEERASVVNQYYLPIIRSLNVIQGKWQGYQKTFEQSVAFRRWGSKSKTNFTTARGGLGRVFGEEIADLKKIVAAQKEAVNDVGDLPVLGEVDSWIRRVDNLVTAEADFFSDLNARLANKDFSTAALLYSNFRSTLGNVFNSEWSTLSHRIELVTQENQLLIESELRAFQSIVLFFLIGTLVLSLVVLLKLNRWITPVVEWTRVAREIALKGSHGDVKYPAIRGSMPEEMQILTREFTRMATTIVEREKTINEQKKKLEAAVETERKLAHAKKLLLAANMSSQVAHEVRNPLNSMGLQLEMLREDLEEKLGTSNALIKRVDTVSHQIQRLERITDRYLDLGSVSEQPRSYVSVDLHELIENCLEFSAGEFQSRSVQVKLDLAAEHHLAKGDRDSLAQVIFNLLRNALDALSEQKAERWIRISTRNVDHSIVVRVEDNGPGVKTEVRQQIFEPFVTTKPQGHGLGLSISRQICLDHGGELELGASKESGARFDMRIPCVS